MAKISKKQIVEFREQLEKELRKINERRGTEWFTENDIKSYVWDSPDSVIEELIHYKGTPESYAGVLEMGQ